MHYNKENGHLFVKDTWIIKFESKDHEILPFPLSLANISRDWSVDNTKKAGLNGHVYDFSVDCDAPAVDYILEIFKHLMKNNGMI